VWSKSQACGSSTKGVAPVKHGLGSVRHVRQEDARILEDAVILDVDCGISVIPALACCMVELEGMFTINPDDDSTIDGGSFGSKFHVNARDSSLSGAIMTPNTLGLGDREFRSLITLQYRKARRILVATRNVCKIEYTKPFASDTAVWSQPAYLKYTRNAISTTHHPNPP